jgi:hypothetical protein
MRAAAYHKNLDSYVSDGGLKVTKIESWRTKAEMVRRETDEHYRAKA